MSIGRRKTENRSRGCGDDGSCQWYSGNRCLGLSRVIVGEAERLERVVDGLTGVLCEWGERKNQNVKGNVQDYITFQSDACLGHLDHLLSPLGRPDVVIFL